MDFRNPKRSKVARLLTKKYGWEHKKQVDPIPYRIPILDAWNNANATTAGTGSVSYYSPSSSDTANTWSLNKSAIQQGMETYNKIMMMYEDATK